MSEQISFAEQIVANKHAAEVPTELATAETLASSLDVRLRGGFITNCELTSPSTGKRTNVLYGPDRADPDTIALAKIVASHSMVPAGGSEEDIGGPHGPFRWADYHQFDWPMGPNGEKRFALQAKRSDVGLSLSKTFELSEHSLTMRTAIANSMAGHDEETSMGDHLYLALKDGNLQGLTINGKSLDELLGEGSEEQLMNNSSKDGTKDGTLYYAFDGEAIIHFPEGYDVKLSTYFEGETRHPLAYWIWKKPGSPSIGIEPIVGVKDFDDGDVSGVHIPPYGNAALTTRIELL